MRSTGFDTEFRGRLDRLENSNPYTPELGQVPESSIAKDDLDDVSKTGTTTVGVTTADGVVIATDMRATLGGRFVTNKDVQKVEQIHPTAALTLVGSVGGAQSFVRSLRAEANLYEVRRGEHMTIKALSTLAGNFMRGGPFFLINPVLGGVDDEGHHVYTVDPAGGVMRDDYAVTGSGTMVATGTLEQDYAEDLSNDEGISVAARAVQAAAERDTGSGNGIYLAEITPEGVEIHGHKEFEEVV